MFLISKPSSEMTKSEIIDYLKDSRKDKELFKRADALRRKHCGETVLLRGIIEFSNYCLCNCFYCGLRRDNKKIQRYRMEPQRILRMAMSVADAGVNTVILQSGDDAAYSREKICGIIRAIKRRKPAIAVTLSIGERPLDDYKAFKEAGADRYLLKHETANPRLYARLRPGCDFSRRRRILECLRKNNYEVGAGNIVGLPGQTFEDLADDIFFLKKIGADMAGIGPFIPHRDTPLKDAPAGDFRLTLRTLALARIVTKDVHLPATTALATLDPKNGQFLALKAGADVLMVNFTPAVYRKKYSIYNHKQFVDLKRARYTIRRVRP